MSILTYRQLAVQTADLPEQFKVCPEARAEFAQAGECGRRRDLQGFARHSAKAWRWAAVRSSKALARRPLARLVRVEKGVGRG